MFKIKKINWERVCFHTENMHNIMLKMKLLSLYILVTMVTVSASSYSQLMNFSFELDNVQVKDVLQHIESTSEFIFIYNEKFVDVTRKVTVKVKDEPVEVVLSQVFRGTNNSFRIYDRQIVITGEKVKKVNIPEKVENSQPEKPVAGTGSVRGNITDERGFPMVGATVIVDKTTVGTIADANGNYQLLGVPAGRQIVKFSFVGYNTENREIELEKGDVVVINVKMAMSQVELLEVVAYGQARGQQAAINQQLKASGIVNVISAEKLQELPDVNVAEAIGRLPGLMVERNRGEGQKIIIRGLEPKYNAITIGGNIVPSTSTDDRSTDLNMISPDILGGVEVQKANTADKDASGLGGTVNLTLREAPAGLKMNATLLSGYSGFSKSFGNYHGNFYISNRFLKEKLGVMLTANADLAERNSDDLDVSYTVSGIPDYDEGETYVKPWITSINLGSNIEDRARAGGSILLDAKLGPSTTIKSSNFIGYLNRSFNDRSKVYSLINNQMNQRQYTGIINQLVFSNAVTGKHFILGSVFDWGLARSQSINNKPYEHNITFEKQNAFNNLAVGKSYDIGPPELVTNPENVNDFIDQYFWTGGNFRTYESEEIESSVYANWQTPFRFGQFLSGYIKAGTSYRVKDRDRTNVRYNRPMDPSGSVSGFLAAYPETILTTVGVPGNISMVNFLDENYKPKEFLNNQYEYFKIDNVLDKKLLATIYDDFLKDFYHFIESGAKDDYVTKESVTAYYLMSEINFGKYVTFIPGVRYEKSYINYKAYIADEISADERTPIEVDFQDTVATNSYYNILPQIHLRIKPTDWFDIRLAYTNTLSRPDYGQLAPKRLINLTAYTVAMGNTLLNPAYSRNYDIILTCYKQKFGLLTLGAFYKDIEGFIWTRKAMVVSGTATDPELLNLPLHTTGFDITYPINNPNKSSIAGFEVDIQSNMNFLPVKGFVFNMNFTLMDSETRYSETLKVRTLNPDYGKIPGVPRVIFVNYDTAYVDRLLKQPGYLANVGLGYDNKKIGLSVRLSFNFQDEILTREQRRVDGADRGVTLEFYRWDFQVNQRITKKLSFTGNVANIFNQPDRSIRCITGYLESVEYYGSLAQFGLKYDFY